MVIIIKVDNSDLLPATSLFSLPNPMHNNLNAFRILCALTLGLLVAVPHADARTIAWGNSAGDTVIYSDGTPVDDQVIFELGSFGSFTPDSSNMEFWSSNWKVFDRAQAPDSSGWNSADSVFSSVATLNSDGTSSAAPPLSPYVFAGGEQAYIWAYKTSQTLSFADEWALITNDAADGIPGNDWLFPAPSDQTSLPLDWRVSDASTVIFGGVNSVQGPGDYTSAPGVFDLQLHSTIPEPGSSFLIAIAGFSVLLRRRKRA